MREMYCILQQSCRESAQKPCCKAKKVYQLNLVNVFKPWAKKFPEKPAGEHDYANIKTLINLPCFFLSLSLRTAIVQLTPEKKK